MDFDEIEFETRPAEGLRNGRDQRRCNSPSAQHLLVSWRILGT